jgi:hypothetical protein
MRRRGGASVNRRYDRMSGKGRLDRRVTLDVSHLADAYDVGIETERRYDKILLGDVV